MPVGEARPELRACVPYFYQSSLKPGLVHGVQSQIGRRSPRECRQADGPGASKTTLCPLSVQPGAKTVLGKNQFQREKKSTSRFPSCGILYFTIHVVIRILAPAQQSHCGVVRADSAIHSMVRCGKVVCLRRWADSWSVPEDQL